jgi:hypothetical protein
MPVGQWTVVQQRVPSALDPGNKSQVSIRMSGAWFFGVLPQMTMRHANWPLPRTLQGPVGVPPREILRGDATSRFFDVFHVF